MTQFLENIDFREEEFLELLALEGLELYYFDGDDLIWVGWGVLVSS